MTDSVAPHRQNSAFQQAGYAVVHSFLQGGPDAIVEVTITPSRGALGHTAFRNVNPGIASADDIRKHAIVAMSGIVAMRQLLGTTDTGCSASLLRARVLAERYLFLTDTNLSANDEARQGRITSLLEQWEQDCRELVAVNEAAIRRVSEALIERGTLSAADLEGLLSA